MFVRVHRKSSAAVVAALAAIAVTAAAAVPAAAQAQAPAPPPPVNVGWNDGFFIQSPDGLLGRSTPVGGTTRDFPPNAMSVWFRDGEYFECGGVFFQEVAGGGFKIVPPPWTNTNAVVPDALAQAN